MHVEMPIDPMKRLIDQKRLINTCNGLTADALRRIQSFNGLIKANLDQIVNYVTEVINLQATGHGEMDLFPTYELNAQFKEQQKALNRLDNDLENDEVKPYVERLLDFKMGSELGQLPGADVDTNNDLDPSLAFLVKAVLYKPVLLASMRTFDTAREAFEQSFVAGRADDVNESRINFSPTFAAQFISRANDSSINKAFLESLDGLTEGHFLCSLAIMSDLPRIDDEQMKSRIVSIVVDNFQDGDFDEGYAEIVKLLYPFDRLAYDRDLFTVLESLLFDGDEECQTTALHALSKAELDCTEFAEHGTLFPSLMNILRESESGEQRIYAAYILSKSKNLSQKQLGEIVDLFNSDDRAELAYAILPGYLESNEDEEEIGFAVDRMYEIIDRSVDQNNLPWVFATLALIPLVQKMINNPVTRFRDDNKDPRIAVEMVRTHAMLPEELPDHDYGFAQSKLRELNQSTLAHLRAATELKDKISFIDALLISSPDNVAELLKYATESEDVRDYILANVIALGDMAFDRLLQILDQASLDPLLEYYTVYCLKYIAIPTDDLLKGVIREKAYDQDSYYDALHKIASVSFNHSADRVKEVSHKLLERYPYFKNDQSKLLTFTNLTDNWHVNQDFLLEQSAIEVEDDEAATIKQVRKDLCARALRFQSYLPALA